jgi:hypothetical protein
LKKSSKNRSAQFYLGTALNILAALIVVAVCIGVETVHLSIYFALAAVPFIVVGGSLKLYALLKSRAEMKKKADEIRRIITGWK